jgi:hypothetical protein
MQKRADLNFSIGEMNKDTEKTGILIHVPVALNILENVALPFNKDTKDEFYLSWKNFWNGVVNLDESGAVYKNEELKKVGLGAFVDRLRNNRELLVYAQRQYFHSEFSDFDPSNRLIWKGHNRPWDYDHILPSAVLNGQGKGSKETRVYNDICKAWQQSIGNLVAVDFTFNRSAQAIQNASAKYGPGSAQAEKLCGNFSNIDAFDIKFEDTNSLEASRKFIRAARDRMLELYKDWYDNLLIGSHT